MAVSLGVTDFSLIFVFLVSCIDKIGKQDCISTHVQNVYGAFCTYQWKRPHHTHLTSRQWSPHREERTHSYCQGNPRALLTTFSLFAWQLKRPAVQEREEGFPFPFLLFRLLELGQLDAHVGVSSNLATNVHFVVTARKCLRGHSSETRSMWSRKGFWELVKYNYSWLFSYLQQCA